MSEGNRREKAKRRKETAVRERERRGKELRMFEDYRDKSRGKNVEGIFVPLIRTKWNVSLLLPLNSLSEIFADFTQNVCKAS